MPRPARAGKIRSTFQSYVSKDIANQLIENQDETKLGGEEKKVAMLFSDIASFSTMPKMTAAETVSFLNDYFSVAGDAVISNDGVINKFIGDAITPSGAHQNQLRTPVKKLH